MRTSSVRFLGVLLVAAACSSSDDPGGGGEIQDQQDVKQFFDAVMPELIAAFTELANQLTFPASALSLKGGGEVTIQCPDGGALNANNLGSFGPSRRGSRSRLQRL